MARLEDKIAAHAQRRVIPLSTPEEVVTRDTLTELPLHQIETDPDQPRKDVGDLTELKASIQSVGIAQPIVVRIIGYDRYQIVMGERRYTAAKELGLARVPAIVRASSEERTRLEVQIVENLHRKDLNPLEEAASYKRLMVLSEWTQEELGKRLGRSQNSVSETLRLLQLSPTIQQEYRTSDTVSKSLLLEIAKQPSEKAQITLWEQARRGELTVQKARAEKPKTTRGSKSEGAKPAARTPHTMAFRYPIQTEFALVMVTFNELKVNQEAIVQALEEALAHERERLPV